MVKAPLPGLVKTRLSPPLAPVQAAQLYACFVRDTFNMTGRLSGVDVYAAIAPEGIASGYDLLRGLMPDGVISFMQHGDNIGYRMFNVFAELFAKGYKRVVIMGSDSPDLPGFFIDEAFEFLDGRTSVILGPAFDGGYYLIGMNVLSKIPFGMIPWSTEKVLDMTIENLRSGAMSYRLIKPWYDIDTPEYLRLLNGNANAPESSRFIEAILKSGQLKNI